MISTRKLAQLKCPNCSELQEPGPVLRTMKGDDAWVKSVACSFCGVPVRIRPGTGLVFSGLVLISVLGAAWVTGAYRYIGEFRIEDFELMAFLEAALRIVAYLYIVIRIAIPLSSRVLVLEQTK